MPILTCDDTINTRTCSYRMVIHHNMHAPHLPLMLFRQAVSIFGCARMHRRGSRELRTGLSSNQVCLLHFGVWDITLIICSIVSLVLVALGFQTLARRGLGPAGPPAVNNPGETRPSRNFSERCRGYFF